MFAILAVGWETEERIPQQLMRSRMINLPKSSTNGALDVKNIRPITMLNASGGYGDAALPMPKLVLSKLGPGLSPRNRLWERM